MIHARATAVDRLLTHTRCALHHSRMFVLYEGLLYLVFALLVPVFLVVGFLRGKYLTNVAERFGRYAHAPGRHDVWLHAVSVGEVMAARPVVARLKERHPNLELVITTTTVTGQQQARRSFPSATVTYFPLDFSRSVRRFLRHHRPSILVVVETEIWPNVSRICHSQGIPLLLINGRISDRSLPRYRMFRRFLRPIFAMYRCILVRDEVDRERFEEIGAPSSSVRVTGNVKFDFEPDITPLPIEDDLLGMFGRKPVVVFGSVVESEEEAVMPLIERLNAEEACRIVIAPRKPERFEFFGGLLSAAAIPHARRSEWEARPPEARVILLDTIGELARIYRFASLAFVGGSLFPGTGGHNPIEPAAFGVPVLFGRYMSNFREIARTFLAAGGAVEVDGATALEEHVRALLADQVRRDAMGSSAAACVARNRGAAERMTEAILGALP